MSCILDQKHLLTADQMIQFAASGYLCLPGLVPDDLIKQSHKEIVEGKHTFLDVMSPFEQTWPKGNALGEIFRLPSVKGIIESLVGPNPYYDHHAHHTVQGNQMIGPNMHQDSVIDFRHPQFDIQISYFPQKITKEMGGTFFVPGTHVRNVMTGEISCIQHIRGKRYAECEAGTFYVWHTNVWHGARSNHTEAMRSMFKLRLCPSQPQIKLFNTEGIKDVDVSVLDSQFGYEGNNHRYDLMKRVELWRYLSGQPDFDCAEKFLRRSEYTLI